MAPPPASASWPLAILWVLPWLLIVFGKPWRRLDMLAPGSTDPRSTTVRRVLVSVVALALFALAAGSLSNALTSSAQFDWRLLLFAVLPAPFAVAVLALQLAALPTRSGTPGPARLLLGRVSLLAVRVLAVPLVAGLLLAIPVLTLRGRHIWTRIVFDDVAQAIGIPFLIALLVMGSVLVGWVTLASVGTWKSSFEQNPEEVPGVAGEMLDAFFRDRV